MICRTNNMIFISGTIVFSLLCALAHADTPANCTLDDLVGVWKFYFSDGGHDKTLDCSNPGSFVFELCEFLHSGHSNM